jgi:sugar phosphate isomerase/epimerase
MLDPAAESRREVAREHWRRAAKAAEQLGGEQLVIEESLFYARLKGDEADETSDR